MMPVYIFEKDAFRKFCEVESMGNEKLKRQFVEEHVNFENCSFFAFFKVWQGVYTINPALTEGANANNVYLDADGNGAIYGLGGWNRYLVAYDGEIVFLRSYSTEEYAALAREQGFKVKN